MKDRVRAFIIETFMFGEGALGDEQGLFDSGIIDSLGFIKLLAFIEEAFHVTVNMSEVSMENFNTVNEIVRTIREKQQGGGSADASS